MRKVMCLLGLLLSVGFTAKAQDSKLEIAVGGLYTRTFDPTYSTKYFGPVADNSINSGGFAANISYNLAWWAAVVGGVDYNHVSTVTPAGEKVGTSVNAYTLSYLFGPKVRLGHGFHRIQPFAEVLFGGIHPGGDFATHSTGPYAPGTGFTDSFELSTGVGVDWNASPRFAVRLVQADYEMTRFGYQYAVPPNSPNQTNFSIGAGVVIKLGGK